VLPVYRERRGISTAWRGKIPRAGAGCARLHIARPCSRSMTLFQLEPSWQLRPPAFHGNTAPMTFPGVSHDLPRADL
jgi:hypothetical protein